MIRHAWSWVLDFLYAARAILRHTTGGWRVERYRTGTLRPVLIIPGVYETWQFLEPIADDLHAAGHPVHMVRTLGHNWRPVPASAGRAQEYLRTHDLRDVAIVAHSKGGLIGKHMMVIDDTEGRIDRMITVNTPFQGSRYARFALSPILREFNPRHRTLALLATELHANARITSIFSEIDEIVPEGSELQGAVNVRMPLLGHFRPLGHPDLIAEVRARV